MKTSAAADKFQTDIFSLLDDPTFASAADAPALTKPDYLVNPSSCSAVPALIVNGWVKTYQGPPQSGDWPNALPTLNHIHGDGHLYREAKFSLSPGVGVGEYPGGFGNRGLRVSGAKELISLYSAVQQGLAKETS